LSHYYIVHSILYAQAKWPLVDDKVVASFKPYLTACMSVDATQ